MTVYRSIRIRMADRPGALSAIGAALAANRVDIVRLDVVSHDDEAVVDDLLLRALDAASIDLATRSFYGDVEVYPIEGFTQDPVIGMALGIAGVASAAPGPAAATALAAGVREFIPCDVTVLLAPVGDGAFDVAAGPTGLSGIAYSDPFEFRGLSAPREIRATGDWAPPAFAESIQASRVAGLPLPGGLLLLVVRRQPLKFYAGELERLAAFLDAAGPLVGLPALATAG